VAGALAGSATGSAAVTGAPDKDSLDTDFPDNDFPDTDSSDSDSLDNDPADNAPDDGTAESAVGDAASEEAATVARDFCSAAPLAAAFRLKLETTPRGGALGGRTSCFFSTSKCAISVSICDRNSLEARRSSASSFPAWRAISGNFFGPNTIRARKNRKIVSEKLMGSS